MTFRGYPPSTFCEIAGAEMPAGYQPDGTSQFATLQGTALSTRGKPLFWKGLPSRKGPVYSILDGQWRLLTSMTFDVLELYDVNQDPLEKNNFEGIASRSCRQAVKETSNLARDASRETQP